MLPFKSLCLTGCPNWGCTGPCCCCGILKCGICNLSNEEYQCSGWENLGKCCLKLCLWNEYWRCFSILNLMHLSCGFSALGSRVLDFSSGSFPYLFCYFSWQMSFGESPITHAVWLEGLFKSWDASLYKFFAKFGDISVYRQDKVRRCCLISYEKECAAMELHRSIKASGCIPALVDKVQVSA